MPTESNDSGNTEVNVNIPPPAPASEPSEGDTTTVNVNVPPPAPE